MRARSIRKNRAEAKVQIERVTVSNRPNRPFTLMAVRFPLPWIIKVMLTAGTSVFH